MRVPFRAQIAKTCLLAAPLGSCAVACPTCAEPGFHRAPSLKLDPEAKVACRAQGPSAWAQARRDASVRMLSGSRLHWRAGGSY